MEMYKNIAFKRGHVIIIIIAIIFKNPQKWE